VGRLLRPETPLLPNYKHIPIGYHGRASTVTLSGAAVVRPWGQTRPAEAGDAPGFGPSQFMDYELEAGFWIGEGNAMGRPVEIAQAGELIFGVSLVNDWSERDIQAWEYQPLGPFLGKSFATSVSPWVVPMAALEPFRVPAAVRSEGEPRPLAYLLDESDQARGAIDMELEVLLITARMRAEGQAPHRLSHGNLKELYWTPAQMVAHHTSNGCKLAPGDLLATGTVSGEERESAGCLLEMTRGRAEAVVLPNGECRTALEDGDEVILRGTCRREGFPDVSLGECRGVVAAAHEIFFQK
jgi:fumarylacetoacetase